MPFGLDMTHIFSGLSLGLGTGCLTGFFGAGGGFILTPALNVFLGLPMPLAIGSSACQVAGASAFSLFSGRGFKLSGLKLAFFIGLGVPPGAFLGTKAVASFKDMDAIALGSRSVDAAELLLLSCFGLLLLSISAWMSYDCFFARRGKAGEEVLTGLMASWRVPPMMDFQSVRGGRFSASVLLLLGCLSGFLSGLLGIGGGVVLLPMLFYLVGQEEKAAVECSLILVFAAGLFSSLFHAFEGNIDWPLVLALLCGGLAGSGFGTRLREKCSGEKLKKAFVFVVLAALLLVLEKLGRMIISSL
jgi:hypothetical protein